MADRVERDGQPPSVGRFTEADLSEMVVRLSHTIRNPLASIKAVIQLVHHLSTANAEITDYLASALVEVDRIDRIVRDMQRLVRLEVHTAMTVRVAEAVARACAEVEAEAASRGVTVRVGEHDASAVLVDPSQLADVLAELLDNAVHFTAAGSEVEVSWAAESGGWVAVHVDDRGPGVPAHESERLLRPFYSTRTKGSGLGLNIVERFCALHGGALVWGDRTGGGARFTLTLCRVPQG